MIADYTEQLGQLRAALVAAYAVAQHIPHAQPMIVNLAEAVADCEFLEAAHRAELRAENGR